MPNQKKANTTDMRKCFLVGPIGADGSENRTHADWVAHIVERALDSREIEIIRADRIPSPGQITAQIIDYVMNAELVVADLTFLNANAFYELGIRHTAQKPTIHVFRNDQSIPFDVADSRAIPISYSHPNDVDKAVKAIKAAADNVFSADHKVWSPVTSAIAYTSLSLSEESGDQLLAQLLTKVDYLEAQLIKRNPITKRSPTHDELPEYVLDAVRSYGEHNVILNSRLENGIFRMNVLDTATGEIQDIAVASAKPPPPPPLPPFSYNE